MARIRSSSAVPPRSPIPASWPRNSSRSKLKLVEENGAPAGEKLFVFYNPPMVNRNLGIRRSYINEATRVAKEMLARKLQTIVFANSRLHTEVLLTYLQQANPPRARTTRTNSWIPRRLSARRTARDRTWSARRPDPGSGSDQCSGAGNRRWFARRLRDGGLSGIDCFHWQRAGRAGRRTGSSCAVFVASSAPLDQFIVQHPDYFFGSSPEHAHIQPDNLEILVNHLKCAAFELPISPDEQFGKRRYLLSFASNLGKLGSCIRVAGTGTGSMKPIRQTLSACDQ